jgi:hypothetical protein
VSADALLSRLDGVRRTGTGRWLARCPGHEDKSPSLSVREMDDGRILLHDFAGCAVEEILGAVGLGFDVLFPEKQNEHAPRVKRPWRMRDVIDALDFELTVAIIVLSDVAVGREVDRVRAGAAKERILRFLRELRHAS